MENLYTKDRFENRNILYLFNKDITEYDIKSAGLNISREFNLLPKNKIKWLEGLSKERRTVAEGKMQRDDPAYKEARKDAFAECRRLFIEENNLDRDSIISIRKDAIWTTKSCRFTEFGKYIKYVPKQKYTSFIRLSKRVEIFYSPTGIHVSGLDNEVVKKHEKYLLNFMMKWFHKMETENPEDVIRFTRRFIDQYKRRELPVGYYRTFDRDAKIFLKDGTRYEDYWEDRKDDIDILGNFYDVLIKLIKIPL